jgi:hypothetical protein
MFIGNFAEDAGLIFSFEKVLFSKEAERRITLPIQFFC